MKKTIFFLCILFTAAISTKIQAQDSIRLPTIIDLEEVHLTAKSNQKIEVIRTKGKRNSIVSSAVNVIMLSPFTFKKCASIDYINLQISEDSVKDNEEIQLLFYDLDDYGLPNKELHEKTLLFTIENQKSITVELSDLDYTFCGRWFSPYYPRVLFHFS